MSRHAGPPAAATTAAAAAAATVVPTASPSNLHTTPAADSLLMAIHPKMATTATSKSPISFPGYHRDALRSPRTALSLALQPAHDEAVPLAAPWHSAAAPGPDRGDASASRHAAPAFSALDAAGIPFGRSGGLRHPHSDAGRGNGDDAQGAPGDIRARSSANTSTHTKTGAAADADAEGDGTMLSGMNAPYVAVYPPVTRSPTAYPTNSPTKTNSIHTGSETDSLTRELLQAPRQSMQTEISPVLTMSRHAYAMGFSSETMVTSTAATAGLTAPPGTAGQHPLASLHIAPPIAGAPAYPHTPMSAVSTATYDAAPAAPLLWSSLSLSRSLPPQQQQQHPSTVSPTLSTATTLVAPTAAYPSNSLPHYPMPRGGASSPWPPSLQAQPQPGMYHPYPTQQPPVPKPAATLTGGPARSHSGASKTTTSSFARVTRLMTHFICTLATFPTAPVPSKSSGWVSLVSQLPGRPPAAFWAFASRTLTQAKLPLNVVLLALKYVVRYHSAMLRHATPASDRLDAFALFLCSLMAANKILVDARFSNRLWSRLAEWPLPLVNSVERRFLAALEWDLAVDPVEFKTWQSTLQKLAKWLEATVSTTASMAASTSTTSRIAPMKGSMAVTTSGSATLPTMHDRSHAVSHAAQGHAALVAPSSEAMTLEYPPYGGRGTPCSSTLTMTSAPIAAGSAATALSSAVVTSTTSATPLSLTAPPEGDGGVAANCQAPMMALGSAYGPNHDVVGHRAYHTMPASIHHAPTAHRAVPAAIAALPDADVPMHLSLPAAPASDDLTVLLEQHRMLSAMMETTDPSVRARTYEVLEALQRPLMAPHQPAMLAGQTGDLVYFGATPHAAMHHRSLPRMMPLASGMDVGGGLSWKPSTVAASAAAAVADSLRQPQAHHTLPGASSRGSLTAAGGPRPPTVLERMDVMMVDADPMPSPSRFPP
ncbi:hypothetical protein CXG81DRAFT_21388 [Caulochytrium protostelioides]|uniref:Cyclin N-terminal domain-containing protein n=1 Tax=Caulochytrium protostelioides TaxID=1555241 RepID=A0A4P9WY06_9FUNG|nr:hypothetical protein CXG81DRAFT_21388 [Caulochytrium protostelioides]|eukprot:RKO98369.1 hypothetical protein CXG81DRAFT_21388 [Caulochytrium protostelioides]